IERRDQVEKVGDEHVEVADVTGDAAEPAELAVERRELVADERPRGPDQRPAAPRRNAEAVELLGIGALADSRLRALERVALVIEQGAEALDSRHFPGDPKPLGRGKGDFGSAVLEEAAARLAPEPARRDVLPEQRVRRVPRVAEPTLEHLHDRDERV